MKKIVLATAIALTSFSAMTPAFADYYHDHHCHWVWHHHHHVKECN